MKNYLLLHKSEKFTQHFFASDIPTAKAKVKLSQWSASDCVLCHKVNNHFEPVMRAVSPYLYIIDLYHEMQTYLSLYADCINNLPFNFPKDLKFKK